MKAIRVDYGVSTSFQFTLTQENFNGATEIVFAIKNNVNDKQPIVERHYKEVGTYIETITAEESLQIQRGAVYDFARVFHDGTANKLTPNGAIDLNKGVYHESTSN